MVGANAATIPRRDIEESYATVFFGEVLIITNIHLLRASHDEPMKQAKCHKAGVTQPNRLTVHTTFAA